MHQSDKPATAWQFLHWKPGSPVQAYIRQQLILAELAVDVAMAI